jgi:hypothetical protein
VLVWIFTNLVTVHSTASSSRSSGLLRREGVVCRPNRTPPCAWERVGVVVGCRLPWRIPIDGEGRQPCRVLGNLALLSQDGSAQRPKWSPAGRSTADCSSSGPWPPSSPLLRVAVYSPGLRQSVRSVLNKVSGVSRLLSPRAYETSTDGRFLRRHARRQSASGSVRWSDAADVGGAVSDVTDCRAVSSR